MISLGQSLLLRSLWVLNFDLSILEVSMFLEIVFSFFIWGEGVFKFFLRTLTKFAQTNTHFSYFSCLIILQYNISNREREGCSAHKGVWLGNLILVTVKVYLNICSVGGQISHLDQHSLLVSWLQLNVFIINLFCHCSVPSKKKNIIILITDHLCV